jgi:Protein of unknown function (DUF3153)
MRFPAIVVNSVFVDGFSHLRRWWITGRSVLLMLVLTLGLTGCLEAETNIQFDSPQHGQVVQQIQLGSQLAAAQGWLNQLETQARKLGANVQRPSRQTLSIVLPFTNAEDLETKFNQLVTPPATSDLPPIVAHLQVSTSNLLLFQRNRLVYDIDLTPLGLPAMNGDETSNSGNDLGLDLNFGVAGPWVAGGQSAQKSGGQARWDLQPGQQNRIVATLWMPSPIGLGAAVIVGLVVATTYYQRQRT